MLSDAKGSMTLVARTGAPSHRTKVLERLLEHYAELVDPMQMRDQPGEGTGLILMPATYTASVRELERLICSLREDRHGPIRKWTALNERDQPEAFAASPRRLWWHLNAWYIAVEHKTYTPPLRVQKGAKRKLVKLQVDQHGQALPQVRVLRSPEARYPIALKAVEWLSENWGLQSEPMLPQELVNAA